MRCKKMLYKRRNIIYNMCCNNDNLLKRTSFYFDVFSESVRLVQAHNTKVKISPVRGIGE